MKNLSKKISIIALTVLTVCSAKASWNYLGEGKFKENDSVVDYSCKHPGGHLLVVYGKRLNDDSEINYEEGIQPIYVAPEFEASPLVVSNQAKSLQFSKSFLSIQSRNPGSDSFGIQFSLSRKDKKPFYVNAVVFAPAFNQNFALLGDQKENSVVSIMKIHAQSKYRKLEFGNSFPTTNETYVWNTGFFLFENITSLTANEYSWDQNTPWSGEPGEFPPTSTILYKFSPNPVEDKPNYYSGYGFWVCGESSEKTEPQTVFSNNPGEIYKEKNKT